MSQETEVQPQNAGQLAYYVAGRACRCLADKQLDAFPGPHVKGDDSAILA